MRKKRAYTCGAPVYKKGFRKVRVYRERPAGGAWAAALLVTMLMVFLATCGHSGGVSAKSAFAVPRVTREISLAPFEIYMVSLYSCTSGAEARLLASGCTGNGAAGYIYEADGKWQVLGAAYEQAQEAGRIAERILSEKRIDAQVISLSAPKIDMRITATEAGIDAVVEADAFLRRQTELMGDFAQQLDNGEMGSGVACTLCSVTAARAFAHAGILEEIPGADENILCAEFVKRLTALGKMLEIIAGSGGEKTAVISGMIRCAQIDAFIGLAELQKKLAGT